MGKIRKGRSKKDRGLKEKIASAYAVAKRARAGTTRERQAEKLATLCERYSIKPCGALAGRFMYGVDLRALADQFRKSLPEIRDLLTSSESDPKPRPQSSRNRSRG